MKDREREREREGKVIEDTLLILHIISTHECSPWTSPSTMAELVRFSNLSSPLYIIDLEQEKTLKPKNIPQKNGRYTLLMIN